MKILSLGLLFLCLGSGIVSAAPGHREVVKQALEVASKIKVSDFYSHNATFAAAVPAHLAKVKEALELQKFSQDAEVNGDVVERLKIWNSFNAEATRRISQPDVTYSWWFLFNFRLSILVTPRPKRTTHLSIDLVSVRLFEEIYSNNVWKNHTNLVEFLQGFFEKYKNTGVDTRYAGYLLLMEGSYHSYGIEDHRFIPVLDGDFSTEVINAFAFSPAFLIGMTMAPVWADGEYMWPDRFFRHELVHYSNFNYVAQRLGNREKTEAFHPILLKVIQEISDPLEKERASFVLFLVCHEAPWIYGKLYKDLNPTDPEISVDYQTFKTYSLDPHFLGGILPTTQPITLETVDLILGEAIDSFNRARGIARERLALIWPQS